MKAKTPDQMIVALIEASGRQRLIPLPQPLPKRIRVPQWTGQGITERIFILQEEPALTEEGFTRAYLEEGPQPPQMKVPPVGHALHPMIASEIYRLINEHGILIRGQDRGPRPRGKSPLRQARDELIQAMLKAEETEIMDGPRKAHEELDQFIQDVKARLEAEPGRGWDAFRWHPLP